MKIYLATDHAGFELKEKIKKHLIEKGYEIEDFGALSFNKDDDYPDFISKAAEAIAKNPDNRAIIFGGSGEGEAMLANKYKNVRAVIFYSPVVPKDKVDVTGRDSTDPYEMIRLTREHNNSNILSLGARFLSEDEALQAIEQWLVGTFDPNSRHARRLKKIDEMERKLEN